MLKILNPSEIENWNEMVLSFPRASVFHTSEWAATLQDAYGFRPVYFSTFDQGRLKSVLPAMEVDSVLTGKRGISLPFSDMCEPLVDGPDEFKKLFSAALEHGRKNNWRYFEVRGGMEYLREQQESESYWEHSLDLSGDTESVFRKFRDSNRRNIKKAKRADVEVTISTSAEALAEFCRLNEITRKVHGLPPQPLSFFKQLRQKLLAKKKGFVALATYQGWHIAASVYLLFGDKALYKYGASDKNFQNLRGNNAVMWRAIQWCCEKGYKSLCFGRTEMDNEGLRIFKNGWGVNETPIRYYRYDLGKESFVRKAPMALLQKRIIERLPIPVLNAAGKLLYRHMG
jgi:hypothetical protein